MGKNKSEKKFTLILWGIVLAALLMRILCALPALREGHECLLRIDSGTYIEPALALLQDGQYWTGPGSGIPMTRRPAGIALILAGLFALFGRNYVLTALLNCLASALTCYPAGLCGRLLGGRRAGIWAAALLAFNLTSIAQAPLLLADSMLGLFCAWALYYVLKSRRERSLSAFGLSSLLLALGSWIKPVNVPVLAGAMPLLALIFFGFRRKTVYALGMVLITCLTLIFPVMLHNYRCGAEFDMDSNRGDMLFHSGAAILGAVTGEDTGVIRNRLAQETLAYLDAHPELYPDIRSRNAYCHQKYFELIRQYPGAFLRTHLPQWTMLLPDLPTFLENNRLTVTGRGTLDVMRKDGVFAALKHYLDGRLHLVLPVLPFLLITGFLYLGAGMLLLIWLYHWKSQWLMLILFGIFAFFYLFAGGPVVMPR
ncbi:MAG: glycosyltransferase family 39 protein, partial [Lentisphaeria bacterium]|nr:glycosyltransferase family 39 protein [Lentisphaeria bacterium]